jgi:hypothetical protein
MPARRLAAALACLLAPALAAADWPCPQRADVDGDGKPDAVVLEPTLAGVRVAGGILALPLAAPAVAQICLGDLEGRGRTEVVAVVFAATDRDPTFRRRLFVYRAGRAALVPVFLGTAGAGAFVAIGLADLDGDRRFEVLARERVEGRAETRVYRWQGFGLVEDPALAAKATFTDAFAGAAATPTAARTAAAVRARLGERPTWPQLRAALGPGQGLSLLARPATQEAQTLLRAVDATRVMPSVLDVLAVLGSQRAVELLKPELAASPAVVEVLRQGAQALARGAAFDTQSIAGRWLVALRWLLLPFPEGYAPFQRAASWPDHALVSAAASFTELRRDTVLYAEPPHVWMEGGHERELPPGKTGYVEPVPELFEELAAVLDRLRAAAVATAGPGLERADHPGRGRSVVASLEAGTALLSFLGQAARAELAGRPLTTSDHERLSHIGHELEGVLAGKGTLRAEPVPVVADLFVLAAPGSGATRRLAIATGPVDLIVAAVPVGGRVLLARGAVSSFYSFEAPQPLTDAEWRARLRGPAPPAPPPWARPLPGGKPPRARK